MIKEAISTLVAGEDLTPETMKQVMEEIMTGEATDAQKASFLTALAIKGETIEEITEAAKVMRSHCAPFDNDMDTLEIVGTGGDRSNTINISTLAQQASRQPNMVTVQPPANVEQQIASRRLA